MEQNRSLFQLSQSKPSTTKGEKIEPVPEEPNKPIKQKPSSSFVFFLWSSSNASDRERGETFPRNPSLATAPRLPSSPSRPPARKRKIWAPRRTPLHAASVSAPSAPPRSSSPPPTAPPPLLPTENSSTIFPLRSPPLPSPPLSHRITPHANNCSGRSTVMLITVVGSHIRMSFQGCFYMALNLVCGCRY